MTALHWVGLAWGALFLIGIRPTAEHVARLMEHDYSQICPGCRVRRYAYWSKEREYRYAYGHTAGPPLLILAAATIWFLSPLIDLCQPTTRCAGPPCLACKNAPPIPSEKGKTR